MTVFNLWLKSTSDSPGLTFVIHWRVPILCVLALLFVIPHDPSSTIPPQQVGSNAFGMRRSPLPSGIVGGPERRSAIVPFERSPRSRGAHAAAVGVVDWTWLARAALVRPVQASRVALRAASLQQRAEQQQRYEQQRQQRQRLQQHIVASLSNATAIALGEVALPTSVDALRDLLGHRQSWWGDLDAVETRELYHSLLPSYLLDEDRISLHERARLAVLIRHAARLYARERAQLPLTLACELLDGVRQLWESGRFQPGGLSEEQVWRKYAEEYAEAAGLLAEDVCTEDPSLCEMILRKASTTNKQVDELVGCLDSMGEGALQAGLCAAGSAAGSFCAEQLGSG
uniref:Uncharacterized protein n=1 Tax=Haptolina brevifila TaxID=156173 RepID=A0A7S2N5H1_9EUKA|mmetsp:Transcript_66741/g.132268  ORF Transcript_66741/g.132268 Transcript_66741/m.132268 type:complete len:343 (+) Transcript_66741:54-1082(+)